LFVIVQRFYLLELFNTLIWRVLKNKSLIDENRDL